MKPAPFAYHVPRTADELYGLLAELEDVRPLAGGQSLVPLLNLRLAMPAHLIDLNLMPGLDAIKAEAGCLHIGAMTRQRAAERSLTVASTCPLMVGALRHVGFQQTRNRGTIGGSLAHMDPTAELPVVASASDATLVLESGRGARRLDFARWSRGYLATAIAPDEVLTRIEIPCWPAGHGWGFEEVTRRGEGFAIVAAAALVACARDGALTQVALAVGGLAAAPLRIAAAERLLTGQHPTEEVVEAAGALAEDLTADADLYGSADYKRHLARVLSARALRLALGRMQKPDHD